jgi:hypothetical protein
MARSRAMEPRESGQVRKEAALSGLLQVPRNSLAGAAPRPPRLGDGLEGGCTVLFSSPLGLALGRAEPGGPRRGRS